MSKSGRSSSACRDQIFLTGVEAKRTDNQNKHDYILTKVTDELIQIQTHEYFIICYN